MMNVCLYVCMTVTSVQTHAGFKYKLHKWKRQPLLSPSAVSWEFTKLIIFSASIVFWGKYIRVSICDHLCTWLKMTKQRAKRSYSSRRPHTYMPPFLHAPPHWSLSSPLFLTLRRHVAFNVELLVKLSAQGWPFLLTRLVFWRSGDWKPPSDAACSSASWIDADACSEIWAGLALALAFLFLTLLLERGKRHVNKHGKLCTNETVI